MTVLINRFNILSRKIEETVNRNRIKRRVRVASDDFGNFILRHLRLNSPDGSKWEDPPDVFARRKIFYRLRSPRPSLRQHGTTLEQGWQTPKIDFIGSNQNTVRASISVNNSAPQMEWVLNGVDKRYYIHRPNFEDKLWFFHFRKGASSGQNLVSRLNKIQPNSQLQSTIEFINNSGEELFDEQFGRDIFEPLDSLNE